MFSYSTVVYGLKQNQRIQESPEVWELLSCRNNIVYEHHPENDESCGWPGLHYHGLFEDITKIGFHNDRILNQIKTHCSYFMRKGCESPLQYFDLVNKCAMKHVFTFTKIYIPSDLLKHIQLSIALQQENTTITVADENIPRPSYFNLPRNANCHIPILDLCKEFCFGSSSANDYLTPLESATFVDQWCIVQNISTKDFVNNWVYCLDSKLKFRNTLFFQGVNNLCIQAILHSIIEACEPLVGKVSKGTTGYKYFWKCCLGKRMIALYEPYFDGLNSVDKMLEILEGTKSSIIVDNCSDVTMQRTPIVVVAQEWVSSRKLQFEIKNRLVKSYSQLKTFKPPAKKIHPAWLCLLTENTKNEQDNTNCITQKPESQPPIFPSLADLMKRYHRISNLPSPEFQNEERGNTSDQGISEISEFMDTEEESEISEFMDTEEESEISEFMDTEEESENASDNLDFIGPKLVIDVPQISPDCENLNEDIPGPNEVNNCVQDTRENKIKPQHKFTDLPSQGINSPESSNIMDIKNKERNISIHQGKTDENTLVAGLFQPKVDILSPGINTPGHSNVTVNEKKLTKKREIRHQGKKYASPTAALFGPELAADLPPSGIDTPQSSSVQVNKKNAKQNEVLPQQELTDLPQRINSPDPSNIVDKRKEKNSNCSKKRSAEEYLTAKQKVTRNWKFFEKQHPVKKDMKITFKNLTKNQ